MIDLGFTGLEKRHPKKKINVTKSNLNLILRQILQYELIGVLLGLLTSVKISFSQSRVFQSFLRHKIFWGETMAHSRLFKAITYNFIFILFFTLVGLSWPQSVEAN